MKPPALLRGTTAALLQAADKRLRTLRELDRRHAPARPTAENTLYQAGRRLVAWGYLAREGRKYALTAAGQAAQQVQAQSNPHTHAQRVLRLLGTFADLTLRHLVAALHTTPGSVYGALGQLHAQGLIESREVAARASHRVEYRRTPAGTAQAVAA